MIYSQQLIGLIHFLSSCDSVIIIHDILFVPSLALNLFLPNHFSWDSVVTYSEVTDYAGQLPFEFTTMIGPDDLAYLGWKPIHSNESMSISVANLHA